MFAIIPAPTSLTPGEGFFHLDTTTVFSAKGEAAPVARQIAATLRVSTGLPLKVTATKATKSVVFAIEESKDLGAEGYRLKVTPSGIVVTAQTATGLFYGGQTLRQLLPVQAFSDKKATGVKWDVPAVDITDVPRFRWRGSMLDVSRHFMPKETILKFIDVLAMQKMNSLHLHLTDDQGWRIEIKKYPKLTGIGAWRKETRSARKAAYDGKPHGGFYSQNDMREIVRYAPGAHITSCPRSRCRAMRRRPSQPIRSSATWQETRGLAPCGALTRTSSTVKRSPSISSKRIDRGSGRFPSKFIHVGGDECPKDQWKASPQVQDADERAGPGRASPAQWFIRRWTTSWRARAPLVGWDEILEGGVDTGTVMSLARHEGGIEAAKDGHDVVMAPTHTYFDYYQAKGRPMSRWPSAAFFLSTRSTALTLCPRSSARTGSARPGNARPALERVLADAPASGIHGLPPRLRPERGGVDADGEEGLQGLQ